MCYFPSGLPILLSYVHVSCPVLTLFKCVSFYVLHPLCGYMFLAHFILCFGIFSFACKDYTLLVLVHILCP